jgi:hypothetical protein
MRFHNTASWNRRLGVESFAIPNRNPNAQKDSNRKEAEKKLGDKILELRKKRVGQPTDIRYLPYLGMKKKTAFQFVLFIQ